MINSINFHHALIANGRRMSADEYFLTI